MSRGGVAQKFRRKLHGRMTVAGNFAKFIGYCRDLDRSASGML